MIQHFVNACGNRSQFWSVACVIILCTWFYFAKFNYPAAFLQQQHINLCMDHVYETESKGTNTQDGLI